MKWKKWLAVLLAVLILAIGYLRNPLLRVRTFVYLHHWQIEEPLVTHNSVPVIWGVKSHNTWEGEHDMTEFLLFYSGFGSETTCYGCYYSWDDVPLAFQNQDVELIQNGHAYWTWQGEGDNCGATQKIMDHWYYFEASF